MRFVRFIRFIRFADNYAHDPILIKPILPRSFRDVNRQFRLFHEDPPCRAGLSQGFAAHFDRFVKLGLVLRLCHKDLLLVSPGS
jgi:hypothetical protein